MAVLALAVVPALILENRGTTPLVRGVAHGINWIVWIAFVVEFGLRYALASAKRRFLKKSWFDILVICLSPPFLVPEGLEGTRTLRALRLLRLVRAFGLAAIGIRSGRRVMARRRFAFIGIVAVVVVSLGALAVFSVESGANRSIQTVGDAFWWSVVAATTVGYGDISPVTWEGRVIAIVLMLVGIGVIGVFTATVAGVFLEHDQTTESDLTRLEERLSTIEAKLDLFLAAAQDRTRGF